MERGRQGVILSDDDTCGDCGGRVVHEDSRSAEECADYFVYCTNAVCKNSVGVHCGDMECPGWSHGEAKRGEERG